MFFDKNEREGLLVKVSVEKQKSGIAITIVMAIPLFYNMSAFSFLPDYLGKNLEIVFFSSTILMGLVINPLLPAARAASMSFSKA